MTVPTAPNRVCHLCGVAWSSHRDPDPCWTCGTPTGHGVVADLFKTTGRSRSNDVQAVESGGAG